MKNATERLPTIALALLGSGLVLGIAMRAVEILRQSGFAG